jgi:hypothetical protein
MEVMVTLSFSQIILLIGCHESNDSSYGDFGGTIHVPEVRTDGI